MEKVNIDSSNGELFFLKFILVIRDIDLVNPVYFIHFNINEIDFPSTDNYIVIGDDYGTKICINIDGKILSVDEKEEYSLRYINKDLN